MYKLDVIATVILFVLFFIEVGLIYFHQHEQKLVKDIQSNFILGLCLVLTGLIMKGVEFSFLTLAYKYAFYRPAFSGWLCVAAVVGCDFVHYMFHLLGHKTKLFWAAHVTHHSSEHFNLSTALRVNFFQLFYRFIFWTPLCLFGLPPELVLVVESITSIYTFLIHTERVGKLGVLDYIFTTPSNHRVHHAKNPEYIDKNLGGLTMLFDHLFGTYARETVKPVYGITHGVENNSPWALILNEFITLVKNSRNVKGFSTRMRFLLSPPV